MNIGASAVVPGANDNLSAVGALLAVAEELTRDPLEGVHVVLVSTGSEESLMEGMRGFARRHFDEFDPARTEMVCLECLGGPTLVVLEGEGMLRMRDYPAEIRDELAGAAKAAGVEIYAGYAHGRVDRCADRTAGGYPRGDPRLGRLHQVPAQLPLAHRHPRCPALGDHRRRDRRLHQFLRARAVGDTLSARGNA